MKKQGKWMAMALCAALVCAALTGCMNSGNTTPPSAEPSGLPGTGAADGSDAAGMNSQTGVPPIFDWLRLGADVEEKIAMISEIQSARVVVNGRTALVGVEFAGQYQGEMTQRIRDMVAGEVQSADANIETVAVTSEPEDVEKIRSMADRIAAGTPVSEVEGEIDSILRNVTTIR